MNCLLTLLLLSGTPVLVNVQNIQYVDEGPSNSSVVYLSSGTVRIRESLDTIKKKQKEECR